MDLKQALINQLRATEQKMHETNNPIEYIRLDAQCALLANIIKALEPATVTDNPDGKKKEA